MSIVQKDITLLETTELPDTFSKEGDFLRVKPDGSGDPEWFDTNTGSVSIGTGLFGNGSESQPSITFQTDTNTGIYRLGEDDFGITTGGVTRMAIDGTSIEVGTLSNNLNLNVNGTSSATRFRAGDGIIGTPSYSFTTSGAQDCGMYYNSSGVDELRFAVNGTLSMTLQPTSGTSYINSKFLCNTGTTTNPALIFNSTAVNTGLSGDASNNLYTLTAGSINTTHTNNSFEVGRTILNNLAMKTLNANGPSNFNTFTPSYSSFLLPQTAIGTIAQALSGCDFDGTNYVVSVSGNVAGNRLWVSTNLSTWTAITDSQITLGSAQVQYGNGIWVYLSRVASQTRQLWTSTAPATTWTQIDNVAPWTSSGTAQRLKFINGQFIVLFSSSVLRYSSNGTTWTSYSVNGTAYTLNDIAYSPELQRYIIVTGQAATLYFSGNTITNTSLFTASTTNVETANCCSYSPKYGLFLYHGNGNNQRYYISKDGINWTYYINPTTVTNTNNTIWINDFGGFFLDMQFNTSNLAISRDGLSFQTITNNLTMNSVNCVYNSTGKVLLIVGSSGSWGTFRNLLTDFNNYIDSDNIYNTFNSNIRFADTIQYQQQNIITVSGNNHYTPFSFNRSVINFDTASANANIYLLGSSYPNTAGLRFKIIKNLSSLNNIRIHGYETTLFISERYGLINNFNAQSSPQVYTILDAGYFGSFDLVRYSDAGNGSWGIENLEIYTNTGIKISNSTLFLDKLDIATSNQCNFDAPVNISGTFKATKESIGEGTYTSGLNVETSTLLTWSKYNYVNTSSTNFYINLLNLNASGLDNFTIYFCGTFDNTATNYYITNSMGAGQIVIVYKNGSTTTLTSTQDTTIDTTQWVRCTYKHQYRSSTNYWLVHQYSS